MANRTIAGAVALMTGLGFGPAANAADIVIGVGPWPSISATANVLKEVIEQNFGLDVELQNGNNPIIFEAMDRGTMEIHPEVWLPNQLPVRPKWRAENSSVAST